MRKSPTGTHSTLLLTSTSPTVPELPPDLDLSPPYQLAVPRSAALTPASLALKNALWPTVFAPRRKGEPEDWSRARAQWACAAMARVVEEARAARAAGEVRGVCALHPHISLSVAIRRSPWPSSFPSRRMSPHRRKSPLGRHTSHTIRAFPPRILSVTPCSMSSVRLVTRPLPSPPLSPPPLPLLPTAHRRHPPHPLHPPKTTNITY